MFQIKILVLQNQPNKIYGYIKKLQKAANTFYLQKSCQDVFSSASWIIGSKRPDN